MSLILDALSRAREDANPLPGIATYHPVEPVAANRRQYLLWVALSVAVVVIAWLIVERYTAPAESAVTGETATQVVVEPAPPSAASVSPAVQTRDLPAAAVSTARLEATEQPQAESTAAHSPADPTAVAVSAEPAPTPVLVPEPVQSHSIEEDDAVAQLYRNPPPNEEPVTQRDSRSTARQNDAAVSSRAEQSIDVDKMLRQAREEVANASLADHPVPFLIDLSQQTKDSIPSVYYLRHDYSNDSSRSTVVLNSKTLSVGGSPVPGMKIEEILPDSVVLNYQGTQFRLRALNSWVNL